MNAYREIPRAIVILVSGSLLIGCNQNDQGSSRAKVPDPRSFKYSYDGEFGRFDIADAAEAYDGSILVGKARAVELQDDPAGGPRTMKIEVTHFSVSGEAVYRGYVYIQAGFGGGRLVRSEAIAGDRGSPVFTSWQFGTP